MPRIQTWPKGRRKMKSEMGAAEAPECFSAYTQEFMLLAEKCAA